MSSTICFQNRETAENRFEMIYLFIYLFLFLFAINLKLIIVHVELKIVNKEVATKRSTLLHYVEVRCSATMHN